MIKPTKLTKIPRGSTPLQHLSFEQKIYLKSEKVKKVHGELVNALYDMQNWHLFQKKELSFPEQISLFTQWFGKPSLKKTLREKGETNIWIIEVNGNLYTLFLCSFAFFMETTLETPFDEAWVAVQEIEEVLFQDAKDKPYSMKTRKK